MKNFIDKWGVITLIVISLLTFMKGCTNGVKVKKMEETISVLTNKVAQRDSFMLTLVNKTEANEIMESVMLDFIIYEDEMDNKKITISQIKDKIKSN